MTLFALLIVMALERVTSKSKQYHIATLAQSYFEILLKKEWLSERAGMMAVLIIAAVPALATYLLVDWMPSLIAFLLNIFVLWVCLGCPVTRQTYKRYLQAAKREDFQACSLHSMSFGNEGGDLDKVGKQLVLVNYRQYASVILFFIFLGSPGVIFYSLVKEWVMYQKRSTASGETVNNKEDSTEAPQEKLAGQAEVTQVAEEQSESAKLLFVLDWIPVRITTFGFLVVGHFSKAMSVWFETLIDASVSTYDALAKVSKAAEDVGDCDAHLNEPLQLVKLVKRNIVFILVAVSLATMVGLVA